MQIVISLIQIDNNIDKVIDNGLLMKINQTKNRKFYRFVHYLMFLL